MTREIGPNQRRIIGILLEHGQPMTPGEILNALTPAERVLWGQRQPNLSQVLAGLIRRGLARRDGGGRWDAPLTPLSVTVVVPPASERS